MIRINHRINSVYFSPTGTTRSIVESMVSQLTDQPITCDITLEKNRHHTPEFKKNDLLIIGVPVYAGRIPVLIHDYMSHLKGDHTPVILVAVYGNRDYDDALIELYDLVKDNGFVPISAGAFIGEHSYTSEVGTGRPDIKDIEIAKDFAISSYKLIGEKNLEDINLKLSGNRPYKEIIKRPPLGPRVLSSCILCNTCVINCPTGALSMEQTILVDQSKCIQCCSCVKKCPQDALEFGERVAMIRDKLIENFSSYKNPEVFMGV